MKKAFSICCTVMLSLLFLMACTAECEHDFGEWSVTAPVTCGQDGVSTRVCALCAAEETAPITERPAHDFSVKEVLSDGANLKDAATCNSRAAYYKLCSACKAISNANADVFRNGETLEHVWDGGVTTDATCEIGGETLYTCTLCNKTKRDVIPALGHIWDEGIYVAPECTVDGATVYTCTVCTGKMRDPIPAAHTWGAWVLSTDGATETRTCIHCETPQTRAAFVGDGKTITPTFKAVTNKGSTRYVVTVPGEKIKYTGIYRFSFKGSFTVGKYATVTTSSDGSIATRLKFSDVDENGYAQSWHETFIAAVDANDDGVSEDVTLTIDIGTDVQTITEMSLSLVGEVVAYTSTHRGAEGVEGTVGMVPVVKAGSYTVGAFFGAANSWTATVRLNDSLFSDRSSAGGISSLGNFYNGSVQHNGSTNSAGLMLMGEITYEDDTPVMTSFTYTGHVVTGGGKNYVQIFLMILAEDLP